ncbi:MAG TPA: hypothetical protein VH594_04020 [Trebonia sp.]
MTVPGALLPLAAAPPPLLAAPAGGDDEVDELLHPEAATAVAASRAPIA